MNKCINGKMELLCLHGYFDNDAIFLRISDGEVIAAYNIDWLDVGSHSNVTWEHSKYYGSLDDLFFFEKFLDSGKKYAKTTNLVFNITFSHDEARTIKNAAEDDKMTINDLARLAVLEKLEKKIENKYQVRIRENGEILESGLTYEEAKTIIKKYEEEDGGRVGFHGFYEIYNALTEEIE